MSNVKQHDPQKGIGWRYFFFIGILLLMFGYLVSGLVELQLVNSEEYKDKAQTVREKKIDIWLSFENYVHKISRFEPFPPLTKRSECRIIYSV